MTQQNKLLDALVERTARVLAKHQIKHDRGMDVYCTCGALLFDHAHGFYGTEQMLPSRALRAAESVLVDHQAKSVQAELNLKVSINDASE